MITESNEFMQRLQELQDSSSVTYSTLPSNEPRFIIDANSRTIKIPPEFQFLGVKNDHKAETVYFEIDRYFDNEDLSTHTCVIQFENKSGEGSIYPVTIVDTESIDGKIIFGWEILSDATTIVGDIIFSVRFYSLDNYVFTYNFNTLPAKSIILDTLNVDDPTILENYPSELEAWLDRMNDLSQNVVKPEDVELLDTKMDTLETSFGELETNVNSSVDELKSDIENNKDVLKLYVDKFVDKKIILPLSSKYFELGSLDGDTGVLMNTSQRIRTKGFIKVDKSNLNFVFGNDNYQVMTSFYGAENEESFLGKYGYYASDKVAIIPDGTNYVKFVLKYKTNEPSVADIDKLLNILVVESEPESEKVDFNIMTFNVGKFWNGVTFIPDDKVEEQAVKLRRIFSKHKTPIICCQEAEICMNVSQTVNSYDKLFSNKFREDGFALMGEDTGFRGFLCIASKNALSSYVTKYYSGQYYRAYTIATTKYNGVEVTLVNTHLSLTQEERTTEIQELLNAISIYNNVIICGDFNVDSMDEYTPFTDANYKLCNGGWFGEFITYPSSGKKLDNIIVSNNITIDNVWLDDTDDIDHSPLIARLIIN